MFLPPRLSYRMLVIFWNLLCAWGGQRWLPEQNQDAIIRRRRNQWIPDKRQQEMAITDLPLPLSSLSFSHVAASHSYWLKSFTPQISSNRALISETLSKSFLTLFPVTLTSFSSSAALSHGYTLALWHVELFLLRNDAIRYHLFSPSPPLSQ